MSVSTGVDPTYLPVQSELRLTVKRVDEIEGKKGIAARRGVGMAIKMHVQQSKWGYPAGGVTIVVLAQWNLPLGQIS